MRTGLLRPAGVCLCIMLQALVLSPLAQEPEPPRQQPGPQQPTFRGGTNFVTVDVLVTDGRRAVADLTQADFEVTEDGQPQTIEYFRAVSVDAPRPDDQPPRPIRNRDDEEREAAAEDVAVVAIVLDDYHVGRTNAMRVREVLVDFVETRLRPQDMVALVYPFTPVSEQLFTRDHRSVAAALRRFEGRPLTFIPRNAYEEEQMRLPPEALARIRRQIVITMLEGLAVRMGGLRDGRKSIVYVSEGFGAAAPEVQLDLRRFYTAANRGNTSFYALHPGGLGMGSILGPISTLRSLAEETDGRAIVNTNMIGEGLAQVMRDASGYYLLGYSSKGDPKDGKFHRIDVRVRRRGVEVRARKGYWAMDIDALRAAAPSAGPEVPRPIRDALANIAPAVNSGRYLQTWIGIERGDDRRARVTVVWETLTPPPGVRRDPPASVLIIAAGSDGDVLLRERRTTASAPGARQQVTFDAPAGRLELDLVVESSAGAGTLDREQRTVVVPDFEASHITFATPRVFRARTAREFQSVLADPAGVPVASRHYSRTERLLIRFGAYGPGSEPPVPSAVLLNRSGQKMMDLTTVAGATAGTHHIDLSLNALPPGEYLVEIAVKNADGEEIKELVPLRVGA